jgi:drug/metabolite transporter (DMT)-like permease
MLDSFAFTESPLFRTIVLMFLAVVAATVGDIFMSQGMRAVGEIRITGLGSLWRTGVRIFSAWKVWIGILLAATFFFLWLSVLSWADLSLALPMTALTYVLNAALAGPFLGERVSGLRWLGTLLIFAGVVAVTLSADASGSQAAWGSALKP